MAADSLLTLRNAVRAGDLAANIKLIVTAGVDSTPQETPDITAATAVVIAVPQSHTFHLAEPTRFIHQDTPVDLRSILFAYQSKDAPLPEYLAEANAKGVTTLSFVERLELIAYLEADAESEYIKPLEGDAKAANGMAQAAPTAAAMAGAMGKEGRSGGIYKHERRLGDRNSILRGIKPTVSSA